MIDTDPVIFERRRCYLVDIGRHAAAQQRVIFFNDVFLQLTGILNTKSILNLFCPACTVKENL